jgi:hypothetical protein
MCPTACAYPPIAATWKRTPPRKQALILMMDLIVQDAPLSLVAEELNRKGFRTRAGANWTPGSVFDMLPRLIQVGPRIFSSTEWTARTRHLFRMA